MALVRKFKNAGKIQKFQDPSNGITRFGILGQDDEYDMNDIITAIRGNSGTFNDKDTGLSVDAIVSAIQNGNLTKNADGSWNIYDSNLASQLANIHNPNELRESGTVGRGYTQFDGSHRRSIRPFTSKGTKDQRTKDYNQASIIDWLNNSIKDVKTIKLKEEQERADLEDKRTKWKEDNPQYASIDDEASFKTYLASKAGLNDVNTDAYLALSSALRRTRLAQNLRNAFTENLDWSMFGPQGLLWKNFYNKALTSLEDNNWDENDNNALLDLGLGDYYNYLDDTKHNSTTRYQPTTSTTSTTGTGSEEPEFTLNNFTNNLSDRGIDVTDTDAVNQLFNEIQNGEFSPDNNTDWTKELKRVGDNLDWEAWVNALGANTSIYENTAGNSYDSDYVYNNWKNPYSLTADNLLRLTIDNRTNTFTWLNQDKDGNWEVNPSWTNSYPETWNQPINIDKVREWLTRTINGNPDSIRTIKAIEGNLYQSGADDWYYIDNTYNPKTGSFLLYNPDSGMFKRYNLGNSELLPDFVKKLRDVVQNLPNSNHKNYRRTLTRKKGGVIKQQFGGLTPYVSLKPLNTPQESGKGPSYFDKRYVGVKDSEKGKTETNVSVRPRTIHNFDDLTGTEKARLTGLGLDLISAVSSFIPVYGTAVSLGTGVASSITNLGADIADDTVSGWGATKNFIQNLGWDAFGLLPFIGTSANMVGKVGKSVAYLAPILLGLDFVNNVPEYGRVIKKISSGENLTYEELMTLGNLGKALAGGVSSGTNKIRQNRYNPKVPGNREITTAKGNKISLTESEIEELRGLSKGKGAKETISALTSKLREWKKLDDADALTQGLFSRSWATPFRHPSKLDATLAQNPHTSYSSPNTFYATYGYPEPGTSPHWFYGGSNAKLAHWINSNTSTTRPTTRPTTRRPDSEFDWGTKRWHSAQTSPTTGVFIPPAPTPPAPVVPVAPATPAPTPAPPTSPAPRPKGKKKKGKKHELGGSLEFARQTLRNTNFLKGGGRVMKFANPATSILPTSPWYNSYKIKPDHTYKYKWNTNTWLGYNTPTQDSALRNDRYSISTDSNTTAPNIENNSKYQFYFENQIIPIFRKYLLNDNTDDVTTDQNAINILKHLNEASGSKDIFYSGNKLKDNWRDIFKLYYWNGTEDSWKNLGPYSRFKDGNLGLAHSYYEATGDKYYVNDNGTYHEIDRDLITGAADDWFEDTNAATVGDTNPNSNVTWNYHVLKNDKFNELAQKGTTASQDLVNTDVDHNLDPAIGRGTAGSDSDDENTHNFDVRWADWLDLGRLLALNRSNTRATNKYLDALHPVLQDWAPKYGLLEGNQYAIASGNEAAGRLNSLASRRFTNDASLLLAGLLSATVQGNAAKMQGVALDSQLFYTTRQKIEDYNNENRASEISTANTNRSAAASSIAAKATIKKTQELKNAENVGTYVTGLATQMRNAYAGKYQYAYNRDYKLWMQERDNILYDSKLSVDLRLKKLDEIDKKYKDIIDSRSDRYYSWPIFFGKSGGTVSDKAHVQSIREYHRSVENAKKELHKNARHVSSEFGKTHRVISKGVMLLVKKALAL